MSQSAPVEDTTAALARDMQMLVLSNPGCRTSQPLRQLHTRDREIVLHLAANALLDGAGLLAW